MCGQFKQNNKNKTNASYTAMIKIIKIKEIAKDLYIKGISGYPKTELFFDLKPEPRKF